MSMGFFRLSFSILCGFVAAGAPTNAAHAEECLNGLKPALISGDFSGSVDCVNDQLSVRKIGALRIQEHQFVIYDYRYRLAPVCSNCAIHGGQRILIFDRGRYAGQYKPDGMRVTIRKDRLLFWPRTDGGSQRAAVEVKITQDGFPEQIFFDGEFLTFFQ